VTSIWAYSSNVPGRTCADARLLGGGTNILYPAGNDSGQAGWDIGLMFSTLGDLGAKLDTAMKSRPDKITRLAINVHGNPGVIDANSSGTSYGFWDLWNKYSSQIVFIRIQLAPLAPVLIMGCQVAAGDIGAQFLCDMSKTAFPGHKVVGFTTIGETLRQFRAGEQCSEPGMRDTPYDTPSEGIPELKLAREKEVFTLPWASETSPHAKIALDGVIIGGAEPPVPATDYGADTYLPGTWGVVSGPWKGEYGFARPNPRERKCWWREYDSGILHYGNWFYPEGGGTVAWQFDEEGRDWNSRPLYEVPVPLSSFVRGNKTLRGTPYGSFTMSKMT
jgi:hypothetical protein